MDGRHGYSDEAESPWYSDQRRDQDGDWDRGGNGTWRDHDILVPERTNADWHAQPRRGDQARSFESPTNPLAAVSPAQVSPGAASPAPVGPGAAGMEQAGVGSPAVAPTMSGSPLSGPALPGAPSMIGAPPAVPGPASAPRQEGVYRTRRPALAMLYLIGVVLGEWPAVRLFADGVFGDHVTGSTAVSGIFLIIGLPLFGRGLFALQAGAGRILDQRAGHGWLQPPVAYLTVGLVLLLAAGLAAS